MAEHGVILTYEAVHYWCRKFGQAYANQLRRRRPRPGDKWHLDEVFLTIDGERHYLWCVVDQDGHIFDILVQRQRDKKAAKRFFPKLLKGLTYVPRVIIMDQLKSYSAAQREILPSVEHRQHRYLNNCAENSHQPTRQRERPMGQFRSPRPPAAGVCASSPGRTASPRPGLPARSVGPVWAPSGDPWAGTDWGVANPRPLNLRTTA
jgi:putative transposase